MPYPKKCLMLIVLLLNFSESITKSIYNDEVADELDKTYGDEFVFLPQDIVTPSRHELAKYIVSLRYEKFATRWGDNHFCTGALYSLDSVVTAASCLKDRAIEDIEVVGANIFLYQREDTAQFRRVEKSQSNFKDRPVAQLYDIALLKLDKPFTRDINLQTLEIVHKDPAGMTDCTVIGWGSTFKKSNIRSSPEFADITILDKEKCKQAWEDVTIHNFCGEIKDTGNHELEGCVGDYGSPVICKKQYLAGLVTEDHDCRTGNYIAKYTDVFQYKSWIERGAAIKARLYLKLLVICIFLQIFVMRLF